MIKNIIKNAIIWLVQAVDIDLDLTNDNLTVRVTLYGKEIINKKIPIFRERNGG